MSDSRYSRPRRVSRRRRRRQFILGAAAIAMVALLIFGVYSLFKKPEEKKEPTASSTTTSTSVTTTTTASSTVSRDPEWEKRASFSICIDPGHGYDDPGAGSPLVEGMSEKDLNLLVALLLRDRLRDMGFTVIMTRDSDTPPDNIQPSKTGLKKLSLTDRCNIANSSKCDLFISLHCDSYDDPSIWGTAIYYYKDNTPTTANYAELLSAGVTGVLSDQKCRTEGHARKQSFQVCRDVSMPSVLVEMGFITSNKDAENLTNELWRANFALGLADGILAYYDAYAQK